MIRRAETVADPLLEAVTRVIVTELSPRRVILFGSRARGEHRPDSDYDLMVLIDSPDAAAECEPAIRERMSAFDSSVDVLVASAGDFERRRLDVGTIEFAVDREGHVLYESATPMLPRRVREP